MDRLFRCVVRRVRWLARIPGAPQLFDAALLAWTALFHRERLAAMERVETAARTLPGVTLRVHRLGGIGFAAGSRELAHLHGNGLLDCRFPLEQAQALVREGRAEPHHVFPRSGWISFWLRSSEDVANATELLRLSLSSLPAPPMHQSPPGCSAAPRP